MIVSFPRSRVEGLIRFRIFFFSSKLLLRWCCVLPIASPQETRFSTFGLHPSPPWLGCRGDGERGWGREKALQLSQWKGPTSDSTLCIDPPFWAELQARSRAGRGSWRRFPSGLIKTSRRKTSQSSNTCWSPRWDFCIHTDARGKCRPCLIIWKQFFPESLQNAVSFFSFWRLGVRVLRGEGGERGRCWKQEKNQPFKILFQRAPTVIKIARWTHLDVQALSFCKGETIIFPLSLSSHYI